MNKYLVQFIGENERRCDIVDAYDLIIRDGYLILIDEDESWIAVYIPGQWNSVRRCKKDEEVSNLSDGKFKFD